MKQNLPKISVVSWVSKGLRAFYAQFCIFVVRVVMKTSNKIFEKLTGGMVWIGLLWLRIGTSGWLL
jgi:hypothetical protein